MDKRNFKVQLIIRIVMLFLFLLLLAIGIVRDMSAFLLIVFLLVIILQAFGIFRFIDHINQELVNFFEGIKFGDYQQYYSIYHLGRSFQTLEKTLNKTVENFKNMRTEKERQATYYQALVRHIPTPFFIVQADGRVEILSNATRRTFNIVDIAHTRELANFGAFFQRDVIQIEPGEALLTTVELAGTKEYFIITATQLTTGGQIRKLISLQNVQSNLDATELATWQNLLRVTSHEILNSLAPVSSCAQMAKTMVSEIIKTDALDDTLREDMDDIYQSLDTLLRRSEGLTRFVQSYRQISRMPHPKKKMIAISEYFNRLQSLVQSELGRKNIRLIFAHHPNNLTLMADEDMLDQILINLIRNSADAVGDKNLDPGIEATIKLSAYNDSKYRTVIEVEDNGPGVPSELTEKIFLPFFTTKTEGSGIGLALTRYIMLSHGGSVFCTPAENGGTLFRLTF